MSDPAGFDVGSTDAKYEVIIFHGYTGSPDSFRELARNIATSCGSHVTVPLLPGHGTIIDDLHDVSFDQFLDAARSHMRAVSSSGKPVVVIGYCFGGYLAAILAQEFHAQALIIALTPLKPRFPLGMALVARLLRLRATWSKFLYPYEKKMRRPFFYYHRVPGGTQTIMNEGMTRLKEIVPNLTMPILTIHTSDDPTCQPTSGAQILSLSGHNSKNESRILKNRRHNLFFGPNKDEDIAVVIGFLKKNLV